MSKAYNQNIQFPKDSDFVIRITDANFGPSKSSGNPMITAEWEIVSPVEKEIGGEIYEMAGISSNPMNHLYWTTKNLASEEKSTGAIARLTSKDEPLGILRVLFPDKPEFADTFNPENPSQELIDGLKGLCLLVEMSPDINPKRKNPTAEQIVEAKKSGKRAEGDEMKNPVTGKALVTYLPKVREIFGVTDSKAMGDKKPY